MVEAEWEIASHGMRWNINPPDSEEGERAEIAATLALHEQLTGQKALGWYNRSTARTYRLLSEHGSLLYFADNYADDLPFWADVAGKPELFVPYTLEANDMRFAVSNNFPSSVEFFAYLRDTFDVLLPGRSRRAPAHDEHWPARQARQPPRPHSRPDPLPRPRGAA
jgi:allantoinase